MCNQDNVTGMQLKRPCIEFGVVRIDSAIVVCIHPAGQLLLPGGVRPEWMASA